MKNISVRRSALSALLSEPGEQTNTLVRLFGDLLRLLKSHASQSKVSVNHCQKTRRYTPMNPGPIRVIIKVTGTNCPNLSDAGPIPPRHPPVPPPTGSEGVTSNFALASISLESALRETVSPGSRVVWGEICRARRRKKAASSFAGIRSRRAVSPPFRVIQPLCKSSRDGPARSERLLIGRAELVGRAAPVVLGAICVCARSASSADPALLRASRN